VFFPHLDELRSLGEHATGDAVLLIDKCPSHVTEGEAQPCDWHRIHSRNVADAAPKEKRDHAIGIESIVAREVKAVWRIFEGELLSL
jgi:hypothetical protein